MTRYRGLGWGALCLVALLGLSNTADAQQRRVQGSVGVRFDVHLDFAWHGGFGAGFRVDIPVIPDGFLRAGSIEDDFTISPGLDIFFWDYYDYYDYCDARGCYEASTTVFALPVAAQWNLYLTPAWSIFPEGGVVFIWGDHWRGNWRRDNRVWVDAYLGFGARYHFGPRNALLMRISWPAGFSIGITF